jgi:hypothetical protein
MIFLVNMPAFVHGAGKSPEIALIFLTVHRSNLTMGQLFQYVETDALAEAVTGGDIHNHV